jgi:hypothetical protein
MELKLKKFRSTHNLIFYSAYWQNPFNLDHWQVFKIGTCKGQWVATDDSYDIISILNECPGNGHFDDVLEWFENSAKRDHKKLRILSVENKRLASHLVKKRGFTYQRDNNLIKRF